ncbi:hypothetical protein TB2_024322 [Malus domestica]
MSWAGPEDVYLSTSLASYLDKKLLVLLRDGRKLLGILRSFDQFANAVLEGACERVIVGDLYCDIPLGLYVIRGENVVLIGELDSEREELPPHMTRVSAAEIKRAQKAEREASDLKGSGFVSVGRDKNGQTSFHRPQRLRERSIHLSLSSCSTCSSALRFELGSLGPRVRRREIRHQRQRLRRPRRKRGNLLFRIYPVRLRLRQRRLYIRFEKVTFRRSRESANLSSWPVHAIVFEVEDRETIGGSAYSGQRAVCCSGDLAKLGVCAQGEIIHRPSTENPGWPQVFGVSFEENEEVATLPSKSIQIMKTGMYNLYFIHCDPSIKDVVVEGKTIWKNPSGYLPGRMAPFMNFYGFMSLASVILGVSWFSQYARFWREVFPLQNCITLVITLGMFEMALWYFEYAEFNETGVRPTGTTAWAVTFGTVKRTVARVILLMVSMGYGVVRPSLGGLTSKVILLGLTFFLASEVLEMVENVGAVSDLSGKARLFLVLPVAILDAFFILWIFTSLSATLNKLQVLWFSSQGFW